MVEEAQLLYPFPSEKRQTLSRDHKCICSMTPFTNLWQTDKSSHAIHIYKLYLSELRAAGKHEQRVVACRKIRALARKCGCERNSLFTLLAEVDSLCALKKFDIAWQQLRRLERLEEGAARNLLQREWQEKDAFVMRFYYAPVAYFNGWYKLAASVFEAYLDSRIGGNTSNILLDVCNGDVEPQQRARVTMMHAYLRLEKRMSDWEHWVPFIMGLPKRAIPSGIERTSLLNQPELVRDIGKARDVAEGKKAAERKKSSREAGSHQSRSKEIEDPSLLKIELKRLFPDIS